MRWNPRRHPYFIHALGIGGIIVIVMLRAAVAHFQARHFGEPAVAPEPSVQEPPAAPEPSAQEPSDRRSAKVDSPYRPATTTSRQNQTASQAPRQNQTASQAPRQNQTASQAPRQNQTTPASYGKQEAVPPDTSGWSVYTPKPTLYLDLNRADTTALDRLYGIGPYYARRIVERREALGGYALIEQLLEIEGIDAERLQGFYNNVYINKDAIARKDLRTASASELESHPYIGYYLAQSILVWRQVNGPEQCTFKALEDNQILTPEVSARIQWYFKDH